MIEHHEALQQASEQVSNHTHPIIGKMFFVVMIVALVVGRITESEVAIGVSICSGGVTTGYYIWRWVTEYRENKGLKTKHKKHK